MNQRQKIKRLKKDNELMHKIINNSDEMKRLYKAYNEPVKNIVTSTIPFKKYATRRVIKGGTDIHQVYGIIKHEMAREFAEIIEEKIKIQIGYNEYFATTLTGSIYIGDAEEVEHGTN